jgi:hypothetical protein
LNGFLYGAVVRLGLKGQAMDRQIRTFPVAWQTAESERLWLSMLVAALKQASQEDCNAGVCEHAELLRLRSQLACPASPNPLGGSAYSLRN